MNIFSKLYRLTGDMLTSKRVKKKLFELSIEISNLKTDNRDLRTNLKKQKLNPDIMKKEELRKITLKLHSYHIPYEGEATPPSIYKGYLHKWFDKVHPDGTSEQMALIELYNGKIILYSLSNCEIKFED